MENPTCRIIASGLHEESMNATTRDQLQKTTPTVHSPTDHEFNHNPLTPYHHELVPRPLEAHATPPHP